MRRVALTCDDSPHSRIMVDQAMSNVVRPLHDEIHLVTVFVPPAAGATVFPMAPVASAATVVAIHQGAEQQRHTELEKAQNMLRLVAELIVTDYKVPKDNIKTHVLPSEGGASGVSEAVVHFAQQHKIDLLVVGTRGMGAIKSSLMSMVGLGSVSDAVLRKAAVPVLLVRWDPSHPMAHVTEATPSPMGPMTKSVLVAYDDSPVSEGAFLWALDNVLTQHDHLYVASVALAPLMPILDEPAAVAAAQAQTVRHQGEEAGKAAQAIVDKAVEMAVSHGVTRTKVIPVVLKPDGSNNDIGKAICAFAKEKEIDVVVVGARGLGAVERGLMSFLGLGSVSEYLAHHLKCAMAVLHEDVKYKRDLARPSENVSFNVIPESQEEEGDNSVH